MSTAAMRLVFDQWDACAVRPSIAAAMVIRDTCQKLLQFSAWGDLRREMSTKSNNNAPAQGAGFGDLSGVGKPIYEAGANGARLFQLLFEAETAPDRRSRRRAAVPACPPQPYGPVPAAQAA